MCNSISRYIFVKCDISRKMSRAITLKIAQMIFTNRNFWPEQKYTFIFNKTKRNYYIIPHFGFTANFGEILLKIQNKWELKRAHPHYNNLNFRISRFWLLCCKKIFLAKFCVGIH